VYRAHNIESILLKRRLGGLSRLVGGVLDRSEAEAIERCAATLCISDVDLRWVRQHAPDARASVLPCSLLLDRYDGFESHWQTTDARIAFVGGLDWAPNEVGLRWFVDEVLPKIVRARPDARLAVLARGADTRPWLTGNPAVTIVQGDARTLFASSWISIAPLLQGGGVRIKIPESLALGCAVVATTIGAEGHDLPGLSRADDPERFAAECIRHIAEPPLPAARGQLRREVERLYGARTLAKGLVELWVEVAAPASRGP
jgi:glycosyltransferase involved in cell wall biosynthesis